MDRPETTSALEIPGSIQLTGIEALKNRLTAAFGVGLPIIGTLLALVLLSLGTIRFTWVDFAIFAVMYTITGFGVTVGLHRFFTHRAFEAGTLVQAALAVCGIMALQGNVTGWAATHRRHHRFSDQHGDSHSPVEHRRHPFGTLKGIFFVHFSRLFMAEDTSVPLYAPDLSRDPLIGKIERLALLWIFLTLALPAAAGWWQEGGALGALSGLLWGGLVRIFVGQNIGSSVNSICHMFGRSPFKTTDQSTNNVWIGILAFGEGWHNNHHAFPASAKQGLLWWQLDLSYIVILLLKHLGLAWNVKVPTAEMMERKKICESLSSLKLECRSANQE